MLAAALLALAYANPMGTYKGRGSILGMGADATFTFKSGNKFDLKIHGHFSCSNLGYRMQGNDIKLTSASCLTDKLKKNNAWISYIKQEGSNKIKAKGCAKVGWFPVCITATASKVGRNADMMMDAMDDDVDSASEDGVDRDMLMDEMSGDDDEDDEDMAGDDEESPEDEGAESESAEDGKHAMQLKSFCKHNPDNELCKRMKPLVDKMAKDVKKVVEAAKKVAKRVRDKVGGPKKAGCCFAMTMDCLTCSMGSKHAVCKKYAKRFPKECKAYQGGQCCKAMTYDCMLCAHGGDKKALCDKFAHKFPRECFWSVRK